MKKFNGFNLTKIDWKLVCLAVALVAALIGNSNLTDRYNLLLLDYGISKNSCETLREENEALEAKVEVLTNSCDALLASNNLLLSQLAEYTGSDNTNADAPVVDTTNYDTGIAYSDLARTPAVYEGQRVSFSGEVVQVLEDTDAGVTTLRIAVDKNYSDILLVAYRSELLSSRVLTSDYITIYGTSEGLTTYKSSTGVSVTIPFVLLESVEFS